MDSAALHQQENHTENSEQGNNRRKEQISYCVAFFLGLALTVAGCAFASADKNNKASAYRQAWATKPQQAKPLKALTKRKHRAAAGRLVGNYRPIPAAPSRDYSKIGRASWYGAAFHGRRTANGEVFNMHHLTAAHRTMPLPSYARITNLKNGSSVIVRVNDRGPYAHNRLIDLSQKAAQLLGYHRGGLANVKVDYLGRAPAKADDSAFLQASYHPFGSQKAKQATWGG